MLKILNKSWENIFVEESKKEYFQKLEKFVEAEYLTKKIYPPKDEIFNLFEHINFENIKVVILGQDPYHGEGQGNGIAFSVKRNIKIPPSLKNIYKEISAEYNEFKIPEHGDLTGWVEQGVFLLNTVLTVEEGLANSHAKKGWEEFTDNIIRKINEKNQPVVFMLWGNPAKKKKSLITNSQHLILETSHPSPLGVHKGFAGCGHFKKVNEFLEQNNIQKINWQL